MYLLCIYDRHNLWHWTHNNIFYLGIGSTPTIPNLLNFKCGDAHINIPREIGCNYLTFGALLLQDSTITHILDLVQQCQNNGEQINVRILNEWLEGKGLRPATWTTLVKVIRDIGMGELANKLEKCFV